MRSEDVATGRRLFFTSSRRQKTRGFFFRADGLIMTDGLTRIQRKLSSSSVAFLGTRARSLAFLGSRVEAKARGGTHVSMASKYSRGFESAARWPKTTSSRWSCVGAGRESRGADQRVSARRTRAGGRRRRRRLKRMWEKHASMCGHDKTRGGETHRQVIHGRFLGRTHAPAGAPVVLVPFRGDERPAFRGRPRVRATSARHARPRDPRLVSSHRHFS